MGASRCALAAGVLLAWFLLGGCEDGQVAAEQRRVEDLTQELARLRVHGAKFDADVRKLHQLRQRRELLAAQLKQARSRIAGLQADLAQRRK